MCADIVQAQYEQLEQIAARFAAAAETQQALLQRVNQRVDVLRQGSWRGKGVAAFLQEMDGEVGPAVGRLIDGLHEASQCTDLMAITMRQAEIDAASLFKTTAESFIENKPDSRPDIVGDTSGSDNPTRLDNVADLYGAIESAEQPITIRWIGPGEDGKGEYVILVKGTHGHPLNGEAWWGDRSNTWWSAFASGMGQRTVYVDRILEAVRSLPEGATIHLAGHSQGGHAIQIAAGELGEQGAYRLGSITGFGTYDVEKAPAGVPMNLYNSPNDVVHWIDMVGDTARITTNGLLLSTVIGLPRAGLWAGYSILSERQKETTIGDWSGHNEYELSEDLKNESLPFRPGNAPIHSEFNAPEVNRVQKAVEAIGNTVKHSSEELVELVSTPWAL